MNEAHFDVASDGRDRNDENILYKILNDQIAILNLNFNTGGTICGIQSYSFDR